MTNNVGGWDRIIRIAIGIALLSLVFVGPKTLWGLIGLVPLITGLAGVCPAYGLVGINTCRRG
jgi:cadmium resistance protein CadD (predicted permease)